MSSLALLIDPFLVGIPQHFETDEAADAFADRLLSWRKGLDRVEHGTIIALFSDDCLQILNEEGRFPYQEDGMNLLRSFNLPGDVVCTIARTLVQHCTTIEDFCGIRVALFETKDLVVDPVHLIDRMPGSLREVLQHDLVRLSVAHDQISLSNILIVIATCDLESLGYNSVAIEARVEEIEWMFEALIDQGSFPIALNDWIPIAESYLSTLEYLDLKEIWNEHMGEYGFKEAVQLKIKQIVSVGCDVSGMIPGFGIGPEFIESVSRCGFFSSDRFSNVLIEHCAKTVLGIRHPAREPFRVDGRKQAPQIVNDGGARGWREKLQKHATGYRLMFWEYEDKSISFANVGVKKECRICSA